MSIEQATLIKKIFVAALEVPADKLNAFLTEQSAGDSGVHAQVLSLLQAHRSAGSFLEPEDPVNSADTQPSAKSGVDSAPVGAGALEHFRWLMLDEQRDGRIDRYKLLDVIGEGGYGIVFRAQQEHPVRRIVALKVIKKGMETQAVRSRFESERQTLALMDHPSIAKLYDAGTTENDRPFFVMELVHGDPITRFCDQQRLSVRQRVELFITVCQAVHHAHQKGIIHQDLKPSNILVTESDKGASPKVIDFGVSQVIAGQAEDTGGHQVLGTPQYMSPEQLSSRNAVTDIRSDVYSLGAVLYELLTGTPAVPKPADRAPDDRTAGPPSNRIAGLVSIPGTRDLAKIADDRRATVVSLQVSLTEDLDWIVMKAIHPDKLFRYDSVAALAEDLQRHLDHRPVLAAPGSFRYLFRRFVRRNKTAVIVSGVIAAALVLSLLVVSIALVKTRQSRDRSIAAEQLTAASKAQAVAKLQESYLQQARAGQRSRWPGQRVNSLKAIALAAQIAPSMELRNQAIACMTLPDIQPLQKWTRSKADFDLEFTGSMDRYATADPDGAVKIYRTSDRQLLSQLPDTGYPADGELCFSPDDKYLAVYYGQGPFRLQIWDLIALKPVFRFTQHRPMCFSSDGLQFVVDIGSDHIELHSLPSGDLVRSINAAGSALRLFFAPDNQKIAIRGDAGDLRILNLIDDTVKPIQTDSIKVMAAAWHPDSKLLAFSGDDPLFRIECVNTETGGLESVMKGHQAAPVNLQFTHDGRCLISGSWDSRGKLWDIHSGAELLTFEGFGGNLQLSDDDTLVSFSGGLDHTLCRLIQSQECKIIRPLTEDRQTWHADISPDGSLVAATTALGVRLWNLSTGQEIGFKSCPGPRSILFSNDGGQLIVSICDGVQQWKTTDLLGRFDKPQERVTEAATCALAMSRDQHRLVFGDRTGNLFLADPQHLSDAVPIGRHSHPPRFVAVSPDGVWAASSVRQSDQDKSFKIWNLNKRQLELELPASPTMTELSEVAFSPDGKTLITADHPAYRWYSVGDWKLIRQMNRTNASVSGFIAFSPDGKLVALSGLGYAVTLCDAHTGEELATLDAPIPHIPNSMRFTPDSKQLIVCGFSLMVWNIPLIHRELEPMHLNW